MLAFIKAAFATGAFHLSAVNWSSIANEVKQHAKDAAKDKIKDVATDKGLDQLNKQIDKHVDKDTRDFAADALEIPQIRN